VSNATIDLIHKHASVRRCKPDPLPGKQGVMEDYGWLEHSARRASQAERTGLRPMLEQQGFTFVKSIWRLPVAIVIGRNP